MASSSSSSKRPCLPVCIVCSDDLLQFDVCSIGAETPSLLPILALRCGHLFHTVCINQWFGTMKKKELKCCPFCKQEMMANDTKRIFPISSEGDE